MHPIAANAFAIDFYSATLDALLTLKPKWNVSIAMMIKRAEDLKFITSEQARWLWISLSKRGWKLKEPLDDEIEVEQPTLLRQSIKLIVEENLQTKQDILFDLPLDPSDIEKLANLPTGYFTEEKSKNKAQVVTLKPRSNITNKGNNIIRNDQSNILKFPKK